MQPRLITFDYLKPGDRIRQRWPVLVSVDGDEPGIVDTGVEALMPNPWSVSREVWSDDGARFTCVYNERGHRIVRVISIDADAGVGGAFDRRGGSRHLRGLQGQALPAQVPGR